MESHSYTNTATMPSGEYGGDQQDVVGRHLGKESGREGPSGYATLTQRQVQLTRMAVSRQTYTATGSAYKNGRQPPDLQFLGSKPMFLALATVIELILSKLLFLCESFQARV